MSACDRSFTRALLAALVVAMGVPVRAQIVGGVEAPRIDWAQRLGAQVPLDTSFLDSAGREVRLSDCVSDRPVVLALVYYECPMLCNLVLNGLVRGLRALSLDPGNDFDVVVLSIDPEETPELARAKRDGYLERYDRAGTEPGWRFLVGDESSIRAVADAVGFEYLLVPETGEYAHPAGVTILTAGGEVSRILYGTEFAPRDLKFGLMEAGDGTIGSPIDKVVLRCFHYDPEKGKYGFAILGAIRFLGTLTVAVLAFFVVRTLLRDHRSRRSADVAAPLEEAN